MIRLGVIGLGKMGLSHYAMARPHPQVEIAGICDSSTYALGILEKYTGVETYSDHEELLEKGNCDAVIVATPSKTHRPIAEAAMRRGVHVFCEKPLTLSRADAEALTELADSAGVVTQVGYHNRFVATFALVDQLLRQNAIGTVCHVLGEAYGPVVLKPKGGTWRTKSTEGGGCLYDYAAHVINLLNWYLGEPERAEGSHLGRIFSRDTEDEVYSTLYFSEGRSAQISVNWSDESYRKMTTRVNIWGTEGRIFADRQECQVYLRRGAKVPDGFELGWNTRYVTDLTDPVWFYLRGEEYSAQLAYFFDRIADPALARRNDFSSALQTDLAIEMIVDDSRGVGAPSPPAAVAAPRGGLFRRRRRS
ncbi:MAG: Gfo/Idh/MocA family oxidoreductase [Actinobacteria bacterium]|nr:Gfo/Idh/MocA family oxidoreductase [Actinomycetota bacterium]